MGLFNSDSDSLSPSPDLNTDSVGEEATSGLFDKELEEFILLEKQKATINAQILEFNDLCWEKCITDKPGSKLGGKVETCLSNCVGRFIDTTFFVLNRFASSMQRTST